MSLKDQILSADDLASETVHVPEWNTDVTVCAMTGAERDAFERKALSDSTASPRAWLAALSIKEDGKRVFDDKDVAKLGAKSSKALGRIFEVAARLNGLTGEEVEELEKN